MALQQLGPGRFVMEELWTRGSILRHLRVDKSEKDDLEARILSGQFIFQVLVGVFDQMLNVSPFEKCFLTTNSNKVRTLSIRIFSEPLGLRKYSTRGYNKTHNKLQSPVPIVLKILFSRPETKPVSFFLAFKSGTMWKFKQKGCQENKANIRFSSTSLKLESAIHKKLF